MLCMHQVYTYIFILILSLPLGTIWDGYFKFSLFILRIFHFIQYTPTNQMLYLFCESRMIFFASYIRHIKFKYLVVCGPDCLDLTYLNISSNFLPFPSTTGFKCINSHSSAVQDFLCNQFLRPMCQFFKDISLFLELSS